MAGRAASAGARRAGAAAAAIAANSSSSACDGAVRTEDWEEVVFTPNEARSSPLRLRLGQAESSRATAGSADATASMKEDTTEQEDGGAAETAPPQAPPSEGLHALRPRQLLPRIVIPPEAIDLAAQQLRPEVLGQGARAGGMGVQDGGAGGGNVMGVHVPSDAFSRAAQHLGTQPAEIREEAFDLGLQVAREYAERNNAMLLDSQQLPLPPGSSSIGPRRSSLILPSDPNGGEVEMNVREPPAGAWNSASNNCGGGGGGGGGFGGFGFGSDGSWWNGSLASVGTGSGEAMDSIPANLGYIVARYRALERENSELRRRDADRDRQMAHLQRQIDHLLAAQNPNSAASADARVRPDASADLEAGTDVRPSADAAGGGRNDNAQAESNGTRNAQSGVARAEGSDARAEGSGGSDSKEESRGWEFWTAVGLFASAILGGSYYFAGWPGLGAAAAVELLGGSVWFATATSVSCKANTSSASGVSNPSQRDEGDGSA